MKGRYMVRRDDGLILGYFDTESSADVHRRMLAHDFDLPMHQTLVVDRGGRP